MKKKNFCTVMALAFFIMSAVRVSAQVTIGDNKTPETFSQLEIVSGNKTGLRLPQITTTAQRDAMFTNAAGFKTNPLSKGLQIFNEETGCVETWNGTKWIRWCDDATGGGEACTVAPATPGTISGTPAVAINSGATFEASITAVLGATSYAWTLPSGLTGTSTTNSIIITGATAGTYAAGTIKVAAVNDCGTSTTSNSTTAVTVNSCSAAPSAPGAISGIPSSAINSGVTFTATISTVTGATSYAWTLPAGLTGTSTTNSIIITGATAGTYAAGTIKVAAVNDCGTSTTSNSTTAVTVNSCSTAPDQPSEITGTTVIKKNVVTTGLNYSVTNVSGVTYNWDLPAGWTKTAGGTTNSVTLTAPAAAAGAKYTITVTPSNSCGSGTARTFQVVVGCGAYVAEGVWKEFMCHNLGANESLDPFIPAAGIHGAKYKWGVKDPAVPMATDQSNAGANPTGAWGAVTPPPSTADDWNTSTTNPCPTGYRVPTHAEWQGVWANNTTTPVGDWTNSATNYSSGRKVGDALFLPAAGYRTNNNGTLESRGEYGHYWSSTTNNTTSGYYAYIFYLGSPNTFYSTRSIGYSVRCIAE